MCLIGYIFMLGFKVKVTEKGGTTLGSLLSNTYLWSVDPCGRAKCRTCAQDDEKKEPCTTRNIIYKSKCCQLGEFRNTRVYDLNWLI
jgi:hypothetical protein